MLKNSNPWEVALATHESYYLYLIFFYVALFLDLCFNRYDKLKKYPTTDLRIFASLDVFF